MNRLFETGKNFSRPDPMIELKRKFDGLERDLKIERKLTTLQQHIIKDLNARIADLEQDDGKGFGEK